MAVTLHLPAQSLAPRFGYSPSLEAALSLHVVSSPKQHALHVPWVRACRELSEGLRKELRVFRFFFAEGMAGIFSHREEELTFEDELAILRATSDEDVTSAFMGFLVPPDTPMDSPTEVRGAVLEAARSQYPEALEVVTLAFDAPQEALARLLDLVERYWSEAFAAEWARIEPLIQDSRDSVTRTFLEDGDADFLSLFPDQFRFDRKARTLSFQRPYDAELRVEEPGEITLVPSVYAWPHVMLTVRPEDTVVMVYPIVRLQEDQVVKAPDGDLVRDLQVLADEHRLVLLRLLSEEPRSTQELAALTYLSEPAVSRHLSQLTEAGLVTSRRSGYYVVYEVQTAPLQRLMQALEGFIAPD